MKVKEGIQKITKTVCITKMHTIVGWPKNNKDEIYQ